MRIAPPSTKPPPFRGRPDAVIALLLVVVGVLGLAACQHSHREAPSDTETTRKRRIVSLHGSITETIFAMGAGDQIVGVDTSSTFPSDASRLPHVGYQRTLSAEGILSLAPTMVIALAEAGPPATLDQLRAAGVRVHIVPSEPSVDGSKSKIKAIGGILGVTAEKQNALVQNVDDALRRAHDIVAHDTGHPRVLCVYARGENAVMVFGRSTGADALIKLAGGINSADTFDGTKPLTAEAAIAAAPERILIPSHGLEMVGGETSLWALPGMAMTPAGKSHAIVAMDDLMLLGFGPRTGQCVLELALALHPSAPANPSL